MFIRTMTKFNRAGQTMKKLLLLCSFLFAYIGVSAEAVNMKAYEKRVEILGYLRVLEPIVKNYPGDPAEKKAEPAGTTAANPEKAVGERLRKYNDIKRIYQEGLLLFFEGGLPGYVKSYNRFIEAQVHIEQLMEELTDKYIRDTETMLLASINKKPDEEYADNKDNKEVDKALVDISVEFGRGSKVNAEHSEAREAPVYRRQYKPKEYHYVLNKHAIEESTEMGFRLLGQAKSAQQDGIRIENHIDKPRQSIQPEQRKKRIEQYFTAINKCKDARATAVNIFHLKYPYDNEYLQGDKEVTQGTEKTGADPAGVTMNYRINPYVVLKKLNPIFDNSIPNKYKRDAVDILGKVYDEEVDEKIRFSTIKPDEIVNVNRDLKNEGLILDMEKEGLKYPEKKAEPAPTTK